MWLFPLDAQKWARSGRGRTRLARGCAGLVATTIAACAVLLAFPLVPKAAAACPDVQVVFARGTGEPPGLGRVGNAMVASLRQKTDQSIGAYAVNYPANKDFLAAADGANDASDHVQQMTNECPNTKLVLGGYSQGAAVIDIVTAAPLPGLGFTQPLPAQAAQHVAAVTLFGNPSGRAGGLMTALSPHFGGKILNLCNTGDPICSDGDQWKAHTGYVPGLTNKAASFVAGRI
ncbi:cutinase family protein [Mycobacterium marinum]|uniref:cutinase family protein n=1 Tax=Mycobacterium marinum TaxID=1781 RepID=UPI00045FE429|nr:cutinase family protein [Mycobacterium marinum]AXN48472.1 Cutinase [Mycobacterium marinum]RFZ21051.1 Cutinase [Mycobacterium marinum]RFZ30369.1 Cutinase [Mycobacterium marinum]WCS19311.1 cutinase family protein [Mycobacterium marinum]WOR05630.1 cutinase family protein [Mycobacterium marinum]